MLIIYQMYQYGNFLRGQVFAFNRHMAFNHDRRPFSTFSTDRRPVLGKSLDDAIDDFLSGGGSIPEVSSPVRWPHLTQDHLVQALNVKEERRGGMERLGDSYTLLYIYYYIVFADPDCLTISQMWLSFA